MTDYRLPAREAKGGRKSEGEKEGQREETAEGNGKGGRAMMEGEGREGENQEKGEVTGREAGRSQKEAGRQLSTRNTPRCHRTHALR